MPQENALFIDLPELGLLKVGGIDAKKLLQGQLTCDVDKITDARPVLGAQCNPQGRILSLFYIYYFQDAYYLLMPRTLIAIAQAALKKYAVFYKVELADVSNDFGIIGIENITRKPLTNAMISLPDCTSREMIIIDSSSKEIVLNELKLQAQVMSMDDWQLRNITSGLFFITPETSAKILPHEMHLHLLHAIDFEKGCYTGQEIIARMHYKAKLKNHLYKMTLSDLPALGTDISALTEANGLVVAVCKEGYNSYCALIITDELNARKINGKEITHRPSAA